jgi:hypothetical protein
MEDYKEQLGHLKEMRTIMERSNKFLSLSGMSGVLCGTYALIAAGIAYYLLYVYPFGDMPWLESTEGKFSETYASIVAMTGNIESYLVFLGSITLMLSIGTCFLLSNKKAKKQAETLWNPSSKFMFMHLFIPLIAGGLFGLVCIYKGWFIVIAPVTLIFYGLALVSASKFTFGEILYLGLLQIILGLACMFFLGYSLFFWAFGFGVLHIFYGLVIHKKYERA